MPNSGLPLLILLRNVPDTLPYLTWLEIRDCHSLRCTGRSDCLEANEIPTLEVYSLWVHSQANLNLWPLRRLCDTKSLIITILYHDIPWQWLLQNSMSLESLEILKPDVKLPLDGLYFLKRLEFDLAPRLKDFPFLPPSLECLIIRKCDAELERHWTTPTTDEGKSISRICHVRLGITIFFFSFPISCFYHTIIFHAISRMLADWIHYYYAPFHVINQNNLM
jgi:hypothetical protein